MESMNHKSFRIVMYNQRKKEKTETALDHTLRVTFPKKSLRMSAHFKHYPFIMKNKLKH